MTSAKVVADSINPAGHRLTTMELVFPRIILAEFNTHRVFSRNSASSRAIPVQKVIDQVRDNPYVPSYWTMNQTGMVGADMPDDSRLHEAAEGHWRAAADEMRFRAQMMADLGIHKQHVNRLLEPFMWHSVIVSSTEWDNFFNLRCSPDAQPEIRLLAEEMRYQLSISEPTPIGSGMWHTPYDGEGSEDYMYDIETRKKISVARCARVSYNRHIEVGDVEKDVALYDRLLARGHLSPFEHVATPVRMGSIGDWEPAPGNFTGWVQLRHEVC